MKLNKYMIHRYHVDIDRAFLMSLRRMYVLAFTYVMKNHRQMPVCGVRRSANGLLHLATNTVEPNDCFESVHDPPHESIHTFTYSSLVVSTFRDSKYIGT